MIFNELAGIQQFLSFKRISPTALGGSDRNGLEVAGIASYFLTSNAKAKAVLASLWKVNDASTSQLMQQFYKNLATGKLTKPEALRQAQLSLLQGNNTGTAGDRGSFKFTPTNPDGQTQPISRNFNHPYYWAPFILIGNGL
ncbi:MAG: CHAT domain-containing protein [Cyanobacteria bacterium]|nr:CHAT domain-containing protein [Cyanobacteriota bacterium]